ncbi:MAG: hypothetical protein Q9164_007447, partial [Protoblastenia rupestris]
MHLSTEQVDEVKAWMVKKLEDISDADPEILSDYIWAILQSDTTDEEIRKSAIENLEDFLKEHTIKFVDEIFARYVPKPLPSTLSSAKSAVTSFGKQSADAFPILSYESGSFGNQKPADKFNTSRKRSYHDANSYGLDSHYGNGNGVATKASRSKRVPRDTRPSGR